MTGGAGWDHTVAADHAKGTQPREAVIAGAGIAGLAAAIALRLAGWRVQVVERVEAVEPIGAGLLLQANGLLALDALAVALHTSAAAPDEIEIALSAFERSRRPLVDRIQRRGFREGRTATRRWPGSFAATTLALRLMQLVPASGRRAEIRLMSGLQGRQGLDLRAAAST